MVYKRFILGVVLSGLIPFNAFSKFYNGEQLYQYAQEFNKAQAAANRNPDNQLQTGVYIGYIASIIDAYGTEGAQVFCQPNGRLQTYADIVYEYLKNNPAQRIKSAEINVIEAMQGNFKCSLPRE
ncbi:Rap1a/Tai family immunity protein [Salmonella enterica]|uniref:Rap1a/Tai family immunity protein n=1 Tax=Salmonella enterica TaxID=28901 RepID=UPI001601C30E|nr:Rap1a/Tai family immunity protein [Salmonella enterica]